MTLALQATARPTQVGLLRLVHARPLAVLTSPVVAWVLFGGSTLALYTTPLLEASLRSGLVHAVTNGPAISLYAASYLARRQGRHGRGVGLGLAGAAVSGVGAYLGGHLAQARKVGSRHPAFDAGLQAV